MRGLDWEAIRDRFRPKAIATPDERTFYSVLNAMLGTLHDSHVYALSPSRAHRIDDRPKAGGNALGLGFIAVEEDGGWWISAIAPGGPSDLAGIRIGWRLLSVDGRPVDIDYDPPDSADITLILEDEKGKSRPITLHATEYSANPDWRATRLAGGLLLLTIDSFERGADRWLARQLAAAPRGVIIDLRENGGGDSLILDRLAGAFFPDRRIVLTLMRRREQDEWTRGAGRNAFTGPLVLLVGRRTASAAEAFAALMAESGRGTTVGERTAGRLTGATHHDLPDGGELSLAEYDVRTPKGNRIEGVGLLPEFVVADTLAQRGKRDAALMKARALAETAGSWVDTGSSR
jgi:carboxyl-terminal processing protease